jgi:hypothetical protein
MIPQKQHGLSPTAALHWALAFFFIHFYNSALGILLTSALVVYLLWQVNPRYLPALLVCVISPADFRLEGYRQTMEWAISTIETNYLHILGFPMTVNLVFGLAMFSRVLYDMFVSHPTYLSRRISFVWIALWFSAFLPSIFMAYIGKLEGNSGWAEPVRSVIMTGSLFYGLLLARNWPREPGFLKNSLFNVFLVFFTIKLFIPFHHRLFWIGVGLVPPLCFYVITLRGFMSTLLALYLLTLCGLFAFGIHLPGGGSFTLWGLFAVATTLSLVAYFPKMFQFLRIVAGWFSGWPILIGMCLFLVFSITNYETLYRSITDDPTVQEEVMEKLYGDRLNVWYWSWQDVIRGNPIIRPAGRNWLLVHQKMGMIPVGFGSHNTILNELRINRFFSGGIVIALVALAVIKNAQVYRRTTSPELKALAIATLSTGTVGVFTGHYPMTESAAFWFLGLAGIAYGVHFNMSRGTHGMWSPHPPNRL